MSAELAAALAARERELAAAQAEVDSLAARLVTLQRRCTATQEVLGADDDGAPLPLFPLAAALVGLVAADGAAFGVYVVVLTAMGEPIWLSGTLVALVTAIVMLPLSRRPGAGGLARVGLRRLSAFLVAATFVGLVVAAARALL
jgi:hypothetical protein